MITFRSARDHFVDRIAVTTIAETCPWRIRRMSFFSFPFDLNQVPQHVGTFVQHTTMLLSDGKAGSAHYKRGKFRQRLSHGQFKIHIALYARSGIGELFHYSEAARVFRQVLDLDPEDGPAETLHKRCLEYEENPPPADWDGNHILTGQ